MQKPLPHKTIDVLLRDGLSLLLDDRTIPVVNTQNLLTRRLTGLLRGKRDALWEKLDVEWILEGG